jgi:nucleoside-diphosphate-sugar epimerase
MRVFVTGASGFIGSAVVKELIASGHVVMALARSDKSAAALEKMGAAPRRGSLTELETLRTAAADADGVIHLAYMHSLAQIPVRQRLGIFLGGAPGGIVSRFVRATALADRRAIDALGAGLRGSGRPLVTTFGTLGLAATGRVVCAPATEADMPDPQSPGFGRAQVEQAVEVWAKRGVRASIVRLAPSVHGEDDAGFVSQLIRIARAKKHSAFVGDGRHRWPAVHRADAARLFRLALEKGAAGARYHGVAEPGIAQRDIAEAIGRRLHLPCRAITSDDAARHFGWLAPFVGVDNPTSAEYTRTALDWHPREADLLRDLEHG